MINKGCMETVNINKNIYVKMVILINQLFYSL